MSLLFTVRGAWKKITTSFSFEARREDSSVFQVTRGLYERARAESAERPIIEQRTVWTRPARQRPAMLRSFSRYTRALSLFSGTRWILSSPDVDNGLLLLPNRRISFVSARPPTPTVHRKFRKFRLAQFRPGSTTRADREIDTNRFPRSRSPPHVVYRDFRNGQYSFSGGSTRKNLNAIGRCDRFCELFAIRILIDKGNKSLCIN